MVQTHRAAQRVPGWQIEVSVLDGWLSGYNMESLTVDHHMGNMFAECYCLCMLKTSFVDYH